MPRIRRIKRIGSCAVYLHSCPERVKAQAYTSLVTPVLEYGSSAWDPYRINQNNWLEQVQRHVARFATKTLFKTRRMCFPSIEFS